MNHTLGLDFGTAAARAVLVDVATGETVATAVHAYADGVIDEALPGDDEPLFSMPSIACCMITLGGAKTR